MFRLSFLKKRQGNSSEQAPWDPLRSVLTNKKTGSLRHTGQQHAGSNSSQGATHVFLVSFFFLSTFALVGVHQDEDVVHTNCKHQERDNLKKKKDTL